MNARQRLTVQPKSGFTLIELLAALAIFAIAGVALMEAASNSLKQTDMVQEQTRASWVAHNVLVDQNLARQWPITDLQTGEMEMQGVTLYWRLNVKKTEDNDFVETVVTVFSDEPREQELYSLSTYRGKP